MNRDVDGLQWARYPEFMKEIVLTQGKVALIDDADYAWLNERRWHAKKMAGIWYAARFQRLGGKGVTILMHREIMATPGGLVVDHIDGDGLNCQRGNMRNCPQRDNIMNQRPQRARSSKYRGVRWRKGDRWEARIKINGRAMQLGCFATQEDAARSYNAAARTYFGAFARVNELATVTEMATEAGSGLTERFS